MNKGDARGSDITNRLFDKDIMNLFICVAALSFFIQLDYSNVVYRNAYVKH